jgi:hypothetical protein
MRSWWRRNSTTTRSRSRLKGRRRRHREESRANRPTKILLDQKPTAPAPKPANRRRPNHSQKGKKRQRRPTWQTASASGGSPAKRREAAGGQLFRRADGVACIKNLNCSPATFPRAAMPTKQGNELRGKKKSQKTIGGKL